MTGNPFQPAGPGSGPTTNALTPSLVQRQPDLQAIGQELIRALQTLGQYTRANLGNQASGDLQGAYPGPISVTSTHLSAPLPLAQGGTGNVSGQPAGAAGGDLGGSYPNPEVIGLHLSAPLPLSMGGTGLTSGTSGGILAFSAAGSLVSSGLLAQFALVYGGGAGVAPATLASLGTANTVLHGNALGLPAWSGIATADIINSSVTYAKLQNETAGTILGNLTGGAAAPSEVSLGGTFGFLAGTTLVTAAITGDVTASANSFATTVGAIAGQSVTPAVWTPSDGSGAALSFTSVSAKATRLGNMIHAYATLTYQSTADTSHAIIAGLPVAVPNQTYAQGPCMVYCSGAATGVMLVPIPNSNTAKLVNPIGGAALTNANLSTLTLDFVLIYPAS